MIREAIVQIFNKDQQDNVSFSSNVSSIITHIKRQIYKLIFSVGAYSDTISFGWVYLKTIEDLYKKKEVEIDAIRLKKRL